MDTSISSEASAKEFYGWYIISWWVIMHTLIIVPIISNINYNILLLSIHSQARFMYDKCIRTIYCLLKQYYIENSNISSRTQKRYVSL